MIQRATLTSKGQFTIPKRIRERLNLWPGTRVTVTQRGSAFIVQSSQPLTELRRLAGSLADRDDGRSINVIINEAKRRGARTIRHES